MPPAVSGVRDYDAIVTHIAGRVRQPAPEQRLSLVVDAMWDQLHDKGVSWVGVYYVGEAGGETQLILGPCRDKPACSPIGMHGVCGQAVSGRRAIIVRDVTALGSNYVACDPRDRSEIVIPIFDDHRNCLTALDLDSWEVDSFNEIDERGLRAILAMAGFRTQG